MVAALSPIVTCSLTYLQIWHRVSEHVVGFLLIVSTNFRSFPAVCMISMFSELILVRNDAIRAEFEKAPNFDLL